MKKIAKDDKVRMIQFFFSTTAFGLYIFYSLLANRYSKNTEYIVQWYFTRIIYAVPYIACLISVAFSKHRNPRRQSSSCITLLFLSFIPSLLDLTVFPPLFLFAEDFSNGLCMSIIAISILFVIMLLLSIPDMKKSTYSAMLFIISIAFFCYALSKINIAGGLISINIFSFSFLLSALALFGANFNFENEYEPKCYKLLGIDRNSSMDFDYIIDGVTDSYLTEGTYSEAFIAREFYYAMKNDDKEKLAKLNITSKDSIASIFALWLKFEKDYFSDREPTVFFNICKYMTSNKISDKDFNRTFYLFRQAICTQKNVFGNIDINIEGEEPANILSNLYDETFEYDNTMFASVESFFQGLKFKDAKRQAEIFAMPGKAARKAGIYHNWWKLTGNLYFKGKKINRYSFDYDKLIAVPFLSRFCNDNGKFKQALLDTKFKTLTYSNGKAEKYQTVLTQSEYLNILNFVKRKAFDEYYLNENTTEDYNE